jgi:predicted transposase YbfD/YdcC
MVSIWASEAEVALAQMATDEKSNEITAIPKLLELITLDRSVVPIDAMGCQREIAQKIVEGSGDSILALKQNQSELYEDVKLLKQEERSGMRIRRKRRRAGWEHAFLLRMLGLAE